MEETWEMGEMGDDYPPARVYFGITFGGLAWMGGEGVVQGHDMVRTTCRHKECDIA